MKSLFENTGRGDFNLYEDWVFRYLFAKNTEDSRQALIAVLNVVLDRSEDPITRINVMNPHFVGERSDDKESVMDVQVETEHGEFIDVEMQNGNLEAFPDRMVFYCGRMINSSLEKGDGYDKMKKSIVISFVNGIIFPQTSKMHTRFPFKEEEEDIMLSERAEIHVIELGKVDPKRQVESLSPVEKLAAYMLYAGDKTKDSYLQRLIEDGSEAIMKTEKIFQELTDDKYAHAMRESRMKYERDMITRISQAERKATEMGLAKGMAEGLEKGMAEGLEKGLEKGEMLKLIELVCRKLSKGKEPVQIADDLEEDFTEIERICDAAKSFVPDYDVEQIFAKLSE